MMSDGTGLISPRSPGSVGPRSPGFQYGIKRLGVLWLIPITVVPTFVLGFRVCLYVSA